MERSYDLIRRSLNLKTDPAVDEACRFLETRGLRFCVHFGVDNALRNASLVLCAEMDREMELEGIRELEEMVGVR